MPRPLTATVTLSAIAHNLKVLQARAGQATCMPVVKADAYGHGLERVLKGLDNAACLAVLELPGAARLRQAGWQKPIVLLEGCFHPEDMHIAGQLQLDWVVHNQHQLTWLESEAGKLPHKPRIYLKINTGMNRLGISLPDASEAIGRVRQLVERLDWPQPVLMTHFANADCPPDQTLNPSVQAQFDALLRLKPADWASSLGNSAAVLNHPALCGDIARPGIATYGASPGPLTAADYGLLPAMALESEILSVQTLAAGQTAGYGSRWVAKRPSRIAVVACGYADGYPRHAPDGTPTWVCGQRAPIAGRVSMDMLTIDVTDIPDADIGSPVQLWGGNVSVDEVASLSGTIGYELLCAVAPRVPFRVA